MVDEEQAQAEKQKPLPTASSPLLLGENWRPAAYGDREPRTAKYLERRPPYLPNVPTNSRRRPVLSTLVPQTRLFYTDTYLGAYTRI